MRKANNMIEIRHNRKYACAKFEKTDSGIKGKLLCKNIPWWCTGTLLGPWKWYQREIALNFTGTYKWDSFDTLYDMMNHYLES